MDENLIHCITQWTIYMSENKKNLFMCVCGRDARVYYRMLVAL